MSTPTPPGPPDHPFRDERPLSESEQQALARIQEGLTRGDATCEYTTVRLPTPRTALIALVATLVVSIVLGVAAVWWAVVAVVGAIAVLPWMLLRADGQPKVK